MTFISAYYDIFDGNTLPNDEIGVGCHGVACTNEKTKNWKGCEGTLEIKPSLPRAGIS